MPIITIHFWKAANAVRVCAICDIEKKVRVLLVCRCTDSLNVFISNTNAYIHETYNMCIHSFVNGCTLTRLIPTFYVERLKGMSSFHWVLGKKKAISSEIHARLKHSTSGSIAERQT